VPWRTWRLRRLPWLVTALFCGLAAALVSLFLPLRPDPLQPESGIASGDFWLTPLETNGFRRLPTIVVELNSVALSADGSTMLAVGENGSVLRSVDRGKTWAVARSGTKADIMSVALSADGSTGIAVEDSGTIVGSVDGGQTWDTAPSAPKADANSVVALSADGSTVLARGHGYTILRSVDGGKHWVVAPLGPKTDLNLIALSADGSTALAAGDDGIIQRSADGGKTWGAVRSGPKAHLASIALSADGKTALAVGDDSTILRSVDGGDTWAAGFSGTKADLKSTALSRDGSTALVVGNDGTILRSLDRGKTWATTFGSKPNLANLTSVALDADGKTALAIGEQGTILLSTDGGQTWTFGSLGLKTILASIALSRNGRTALAAALGGTILRSVDGGLTWRTATSGTEVSLTSIALSGNGMTALALGENGIQRSTDGGQTWVPEASREERKLKALLDSNPEKLSHHPEMLKHVANQMVLWDLNAIALSADGKSALAASDIAIVPSVDGGQTWGDLSIAGAVELHSIALSADGKSALVVGDDGIILGRGDDGTTWAMMPSGTKASLNSAALSADGKTALAVGENGTILRRADDGKTWAVMSSSTKVSLSSVALSADGKTALAVGDDGTILRRADDGKTWDVMPSGTKAPLLSIALAADGKTALAVGLGTILRSGDEGKTWSDPVLPPYRAPPRIAWVFWAAGFIALLPAFVALPPENPRRTIEELLATDRPLRKGDIDASGSADQLATQIGTFLRNAQTAPPLTIAIIGPWGSGKSSVLSRLREDLVNGGQRPVWFNAWHRQGEESLFAALLQAVRSEAVPSWWSFAGLDVRMRLLFSRVQSNPIGWFLAMLLVFGAIGFLWAARWPTPVEALAPVRELIKAEKLTEAAKAEKPAEAANKAEKPTEAANKAEKPTEAANKAEKPTEAANKAEEPTEAVIKVLLALGWPLTIFMVGLLTVGALRDRLSSAGLDPGRLLAAAGRATRWRDLGVQLAFRDRFKEALTEVTTALGRRTLTILIDDLDRCRPDQIAEVLEAINFLTDADGCFVVFGFSKPQVLAGIGLANREIAAELAGAEDTSKIRKDYAEDFLRKLIQVEVPVPRFGAPAAKRLVDAASEISSEPRVVRAWAPALGALAFLCAVGTGMWGGEKLYSTGDAAWNATSVAPAAKTAPAVQALAAAKPTQNEPLPANEHVISGSYVYPGETEAPLYWVWLIPLLIFGAAVLAVFAAIWRPQATKDDDTEIFTKALHHWAVAAYEVRQSPREMKRFLNRLRFAAAGRATDLPDNVLVGLAVLEHAGAGYELEDIAKNGSSKLRDAIGARTVTDNETSAVAAFTLIHKALAPAELAASGLPPLEPTPDQVQKFLALWEGVRVQS
jgi:photosystem II stability/assembly factor-like uncharacterized protein